MTERVLEKLRISLDNGDFYGAHQMYLTVCTRYIKNCKISEAIELLFSGTKLLCEHQQYGSGVELSSVLFKTWTDNRNLVDDSSLEKAFQVLGYFPPDRKEFLDVSKCALKWSASCGQSNQGEPTLHHQIGLLLVKVSFSDEVKKHFILGTVESAESLALLCAVNLRNENKSKYLSEQLLLQPIISYLQLLKISHASHYFKALIAHESLKDLTTENTTLDTPVSSSNTIKIFSTPWLNFAQLLILTCQRGPSGVRAFIYLRQQYQDVLKKFDSIFEVNY
ncbi:hypothetical protein HMI54_010015 [Coelomomyces lativittatus]|nr:hypothetical protein HMI56_003956 [Coelomomyces lativittatus]KAJ1501397.1 hypothetical protein HMI54_010015 [Coelomomyces lativittatus]KAJ1501456.1 hypothetical protein HMI55_003386 [Coelomomyces lativittatus]